MTAAKPTATVTMQVEVEVCGDKGIRVITDGSIMGTYRSWAKVGAELADEFKYRAALTDKLGEQT